MATKLQVWNEALRFLGHAPLATVTDNVLARYELDDTYDRAVVAVLREADWRFALTTETLAAAGGPPALPGFTNRFAKPGTWLRTHALFVLTTDGRECPFDAREAGTNLYANIGASIVIRYVSTTGTAEAAWTEHFTKALAAYLAHLIAERVTGSGEAAASMLELYGRNFQAAADRDAVPPNAWLLHQLDGTFQRAARAVLEEGAWRWATKTATLTASGTASTGYRYRYAKPNDWLRTVDAYEQEGRRSIAGSFRDEDGALHADLDSLTIRYIHTGAMNATTWSEAFSDAVLARCQYEQARNTKDAGNALALYKDRLRAAEYAEEGRDRPRVVGPGRIVAARQGGFGRFGWNREQGWPV